MNEPVPIIPLEKHAVWHNSVRCFAVVLWSGFLAACLAVLALLMGWERLMHTAGDPGLGALAICFLGAWLIAALAATMALMLARPPSPELREQRS